MKTIRSQLRDMRLITIPGVWHNGDLFTVVRTREVLSIHHVEHQHASLTTPLRTVAQLTRHVGAITDSDLLDGDDLLPVGNIEAQP